MMVAVQRKYFLQSTDLYRFSRLVIEARAFPCFPVVSADRVS